MNAYLRGAVTGVALAIVGFSVFWITPTNHDPLLLIAAALALLSIRGPQS